MEHAHAKKHHVKHTHIEHHKDGSHTVKHVMEDGSEHPASGAAANLDEVHDRLQDAIGEPNEGESAAEAGVHGVPEPQASAAGLPTQE